MTSETARYDRLIPEHRASETQRRRLLALATVLVFVVPIHLIHIVNSPELSAVDEFAHTDYLVRAARPQLIVDINQPVDDRALREAACRGVGDEPPSQCDADSIDPQTMIWRGLNTAVSHGPVYYVTTGVAARVLAAMPVGSDSIVTWARVLGTLWFALGAWLCLLVGELVGLRARCVVAALVFVAMLPPMLGAHAAVNPDATAFAIGSAALWLGVRHGASARGAALLAALAGVAILSDPTNLLGVGLAVLVVALSGSGTVMGSALARSVLRALAIVAVPVCTAAMIALFGWGNLYYAVVEPITDVSDHPQEIAHGIDTLSADQFRRSVFAVFPPVTVAWRPPVLRNAWLEGPWFNLSAYVLVAALIGGAFRLGKREPAAVIAAATAAVLLLSGPALVLHNAVLSGTFYPIPGRFGLSLVAGTVVALAALPRSRSAEWLLAATSGLAVAATGSVLLF